MATVSTTRVRKKLYTLYCGDALQWLCRRNRNSVHAVVTDPPYGLREYHPEELSKMKVGRGGVWRNPPSFDGAKRRALPRFTDLSDRDKDRLRNFFQEFAGALFPVLVPGAHVFVATNPIVSHLVYQPLISAGFEPRGEIIRIVHTLRGGDRPKGAHREFSGVTVLPKSCWEPWGLFRKPCEGRVQDNLCRWATGGLRRISEDEPFRDLIQSLPTRRNEHSIAPHPSLKPQAFMRQLVRASLPLGKGVILDPFMGAGSTIAAATALGLRSIGLEIDPEFHAFAVEAIPKLAALEVPKAGSNGSQN